MKSSPKNENSVIIYSLSCWLKAKQQNSVAAFSKTSETTEKKNNKKKILGNKTIDWSL